MFIDEIKVKVYGGRGGHGMASYRREKYVEFGGPWGGNGGDGGSVVFVGDEGMTTLLKLRYQRHIKADNGVNGMSKGMHGKNAENRYIKVPLGTIVYDEHKQVKIGEVLQHNQELIVAKGGKGGRGNIALSTAKNPAPGFAENGDFGEVLTVHLELNMLADVGIIGYPSVGKSTFISVVSNARPKIAEYPFTTLSPNLGMVLVGDDSFVLADLPGLIENAHQGEGLGIQFLKHIERCRLYLHVLDLSRENPLLDFEKINYELKMYDKKLLDRPQIVVLNKVDVFNDENRLNKIKEKLTNYNVHVISAINRQGVDALIYEINETLKKTPKIDPEEESIKVYRLETEEPPFTITKEDDVFVIKGEKVELIFQRTDFTKDEAVKRFARQMRGIGVDDELRKMGAKHKDRVQILDFEFEFLDQ
ncbi:MAG: GTPase ObgE [Acholeplasmataceae bacterium]